ncbi:MAG: TonB family protein [Pseudomonadota bacterium]
MYADRYERSKPNPVSLTAAIGINAALVAALLLSAPEIIKTFDPPLVTYPVTDDPPPPPVPEPERKPEARTPTDVKIETPIPDVLPPLPPTNPVQGTTDPQPPVPADPGPATGGGGVTVDPPAPAPVLVDASPVRGVEFQPDYPPSERRAGTEGAVTVRVLIGADGRVKTVELVRTVSDAFFAATKRQALARWRFKPATRDGIPYESWRTMTVRFVLEG